MPDKALRTVVVRPVVWAGHPGRCAADFLCVSAVERLANATICRFCGAVWHCRMGSQGGSVEIVQRLEGFTVACSAKRKQRQFLPTLSLRLPPLRRVPRSPAPGNARQLRISQGSRQSAPAPQMQVAVPSTAVRDRGIMHGAELDRPRDKKTFQVFLGALLAVVAGHCGQRIAGAHGSPSHFQVLFRFLEPVAFRRLSAHIEFLAIQGPCERRNMDSCAARKGVQAWLRSRQQARRISRQSPDEWGCRALASRPGI